MDLDLDIDNYDYEDILNLFKLNHDFGENGLKNAKKIVLATHPAKSGLNKEVSITFDKPGVYLYVCTPHKVMGMIALVVVGEDVSNKDAIASVKMLGRGKKKLKELLDQI